MESQNDGQNDLITIEVEPKDEEHEAIEVKEPTEHNETEIEDFTINF